MTEQWSRVYLYPFHGCNNTHGGSCFAEMSSIKHLFVFSALFCINMPNLYFFYNKNFVASWLLRPWDKCEFQLELKFSFTYFSIEILFTLRVKPIHISCNTQAKLNVGSKQISLMKNKAQRDHKWGTNYQNFWRLNLSVY